MNVSNHRHVHVIQPYGAVVSCDHSSYFLGSSRYTPSKQVDCTWYYTAVPNTDHVDPKPSE